eukprot:3933993-Rhodomonas_salina.1
MQIKTAKQANQAVDVLDDGKNATFSRDGLERFVFVISEASQQTLLRQPEHPIPSTATVQKPGSNEERKSVPRENLVAPPQAPERFGVPPQARDAAELARYSKYLESITTTQEKPAQGTGEEENESKDLELSRWVNPVWNSRGYWEEGARLDSPPSKAGDSLLSFFSGLFAADAHEPAHPTPSLLPERRSARSLAAPPAPAALDGAVVDAGAEEAAAAAAQRKHPLAVTGEGRASERQERLQAARSLGTVATPVLARHTAAMHERGAAIAYSWLPP